MNYNAVKSQISRRILLLACTATLTVGFIVSLPQLAHAQHITPPQQVPPEVRVEDGNEPFLVGHAFGTQNYVCVPCDPTKPNCPLGVSFSLFTPEATLFDEQGKQLITHFFSPNPNESGLPIRATWQDSKDTSTVWGTATGSVRVRTDSIDWVRLNVKDTGTQAGPRGGDRLTKTTFIQRLNTVGGLAPSNLCTSPADLGRQAFVPYTADYFFYQASKGRDGN
jgi:hypothetical protein